MHEGHIAATQSFPCKTEPWTNTGQPSWSLSSPDGASHSTEMWSVAGQLPHEFQSYTGYLTQKSR